MDVEREESSISQETRDHAAGADSRESTREMLENRKLELEIQQLSRGWWNRPASWISVATAVVAILGALGQYQVSQIQKERTNIELGEARQTLAKVNKELQEAETRRTEAELAVHTARDEKTRLDTEIALLQEKQAEFMKKLDTYGEAFREMDALIATAINEGRVELETLEDMQRLLEAFKNRIRELSKKVPVKVEFSLDRHIIHAFSDREVQQLEEAIASNVERLLSQRLDFVRFGRSEAAHTLRINFEEATPPDNFYGTDLHLTFVTAEGKGSSSIRIPLFRSSEPEGPLPLGPKEVYETIMENIRVVIEKDDFVLAIIKLYREVGLNR